MELYVSDLLHEIKLINSLPVAQNRLPKFIYFGGGTPSLLPLSQLKRLFSEMKARFPWDQTEEVSFECAPKTATSEKIAFLREAGVTRISMGIQQLNDEVLKANGRIHTSADTQRAFSIIKSESFAVFNVDLIVGLVNETDKSFFDSLDKVITMNPDSITIYQLEIPPNTPLYKSLSADSNSKCLPDWNTKRRRLDAAFLKMEQAGYHIRSAYAAVRDPQKHRFIYQEEQYRGADLLGVGLASFSYAQGVHYQNHASMQKYRESIENNELPLSRGCVLTKDEQLIRQFVLQLKLGSVSVSRFLKEFGVNICQRFEEPLSRLKSHQILEMDGDFICLTREGLLRADRILSDFLPAKFQDKSYW